MSVKEAMWAQLFAHDGRCCRTCAYSQIAADEMPCKRCGGFTRTRWPKEGPVPFDWKPAREGVRVLAMEAATLVAELEEELGKLAG